MPTTNYIWDEENLLAETDASNVVQTVYTNEPQQYGNLISSRISGTTSYHHFDAIGSTRQLTNGAGTVTDTMIYDAWGTSSTGVARQPRISCGSASSDIIPTLKSGSSRCAIDTSHPLAVALHLVIRSCND